MPDFDDKKAVQLTKDGVQDYSFGGGSAGKKASARVSWSPDGQQFYVRRRDSRNIAELYLVDSLGDPRPKLRQYKYSLPGDEGIRKTELFVLDRGVKKLVRVKPRWRDESYLDVRWLKTGELRVLRRDRALRNVEYGTVDPKTGDFKVLFKEGFQSAYLNTQSIRYLEGEKSFIWWSERSGWGHFYLYDIDGKIKSAITKGPFRASRIVAIDEKKSVMWFRGNAREKGESPYFEHLYRVNLDGTGLTLLDPGPMNYRSSLSPTKNFVVANGTRVDGTPNSSLRDAEGNLVMDLETADLSRLYQVGWKMPETFTVKAADGVTDLYGNMWKPFDFNPSVKYPIILHVYPGPQQEGVSHSFSATASQQQLAQLGFIVIQVGHRGGAPTRDKAYGSYGYFNLRDYPLADKKVAVEQLAARHDFIDINRVGMYGHSGGGFMTAAAMMKPPYNEFFKVGVSSSGNHDNNVYNSSWSERYHGLKEVPIEEKKDEKSATSSSSKSKGDEKKAATKSTAKAKDAKKSTKTKFDIHVPTNAELAENLKGRLLLVHGEMDNNVHPANTMRLVDALIKANKRFDMLIIPGARHGYGRAQSYFRRRMWEYFAEHLLEDRQVGAVIDKN
ncbi:MAG: S9 family peptidase [Planctomycetes bacterium]|nr:S9 family peptidase [Planctomycetota bacterium]